MRLPDLNPSGGFCSESNGSEKRASGLQRMWYSSSSRQEMNEVRTDTVNRPNNHHVVADTEDSVSGAFYQSNNNSHGKNIINYKLHQLEKAQELRVATIAALSQRIKGRSGTVIKILN